MAEQKSRSDADEDIEGEGEDDEDSKPLKKKESSGEEEDSEEEDKGDDDDFIQVRKSSLVAKDNIIARQKRKIEKQKEDDNEDDEEESEDQDEEANEDKIVNRVSKIVEPIRKHLVSRSDEDELRDLYENNPDAKKYDKQIRKYMAHPAYESTPFEVIYHHLAFEVAAGQQVDRKKAADLEARQSRSGGHQRRPKQSSNEIPELDNIDEMSNKDIDKLAQRAKSGEFLK